MHEGGWASRCIHLVMVVVCHPRHHCCCSLPLLSLSPHCCLPRGAIKLGYPGIMLVVVAIVIPSLDPGNVAINTHYPPCKQWLMAVVVGALLFCCGVVDRLWVVVSG